MSLKVHLLIIFLLFAFCFFIYFSTLCPTITWAHFSEFGPKLLTQIYTEPLKFNQKHLLYLAIAKLYSLFIIHYFHQRWTHLWWALFIHSDPAFPINLLSALFSSLSIVVTYFMIFSLAPVLKLPSHLRQPFNLAWLPAAFGSLVLAFSLTFWSQALVTHTTSFNLFLFSLSLFFLLKTCQNLKKKAPVSLLWLLLFTAGLLLNNLPSSISLNFRTPREFWENLETITSLALSNFGSISLLLALVGLFFSLEKGLPLFLLLGICFGQSFFDSVFSTSTTPPFFLPSLLVIALFSGLGFKVLLEIILAVAFSDLAVSFENRFFLLILRLKRAGKFLRYAIFALIAYFALVAVLAPFRKFYPLVSLKSEREAFNFGQNSLAALPENSLVFCENDKLFSTLEYFQKAVTGKKFKLLLFAEDTKEMVEENILIRPVFFALVRSPIPVGETKGIWEGYTLVSKGPLYQVQKPTLFR